MTSIYTYEEFSTARKAGKTCDNDKRMLRTYLSQEIVSYAKKLANENKTYRYLVTFTLKEDGQDEDKIEAYIIKQLHRDPLKIIEAHLAKEYTKNGRAHWHCPIATKKPLKKDRFHHYIKLYGSIDISKTKAQNLLEGINYINKDAVSKKII